MDTQTTRATGEREQALAESVLVVGLVTLAALLVLFVIGDGVPSIMETLGGSILPPAR